MAVFDGMNRAAPTRRPTGRPAPRAAIPGPGQVVAPRVATGQLLLADFVEAANQATSPPAAGDILVHTIGEGEVIRVSGPTPYDQAYQFRPQGSQEGSDTTSAGGVLTITLSTLRAIESPNDLGVRSVEVFVSTGGGNWARIADADLTVDFATQVITASGLVASTLYDWLVFAFIDEAAGQVQVHVIGAGAAAGTERRPIESVNLRNLQRRDQDSDRTAEKFNSHGILLAPYDQLAITLRSSQQYAPRRTLTPPAAGVIAGTLTQLEIRKASVPWVELVRWHQQTRPAAGWTPDRVRALVRAQQMGRLASETEGRRWLAGIGLNVARSIDAVPPLPPGLEV